MGLLFDVGVRIRAGWLRRCSGSGGADSVDGVPCRHRQASLLNDVFSRVLAQTFRRTSAMGRVVETNRACLAFNPQFVRKRWSKFEQRRLTPRGPAFFRPESSSTSSSLSEAASPAHLICLGSSIDGGAKKRRGTVTCAHDVQYNLWIAS